MQKTQNVSWSAKLFYFAVGALSADTDTVVYDAVEDAGCAIDA